MKNPNFQPTTYFSKTNASIIRSLLVARGQTGTTLEQLKDDFHCEVGHKIPFHGEGDTQIRLYLECLDSVYSIIRDDTQYYYSSSPESDHIISMVEKQKVNNSDKNRFKVPAIPFKSNITSNPSIKRRLNNIQRSPKSKQCSPDSSIASSYENVSKKLKTSSSSSVRSIFFANNLKNQKKFKTSSVTSEFNSKTSNSEIPMLYNGTLVGDQFFLQMAVHSLGYNYTKPLVYSRNKECGYCVSGQTIQEATERIKANPPTSKYVFINLGSVDIANGRLLMDITMDMAELVRACIFLDILPVLTTLPPLANYGYDQRKTTLLGFNNYIRSNYFGPYIELSCHFINHKNYHLKHLYRHDPQKINGSNRAFVMWSRFGSEMVLKQIKQQLPQAMSGYENNFIII
ncbi:unnamed protein product [Diamesa serratosioi]